MANPHSDNLERDIGRVMQQRTQGAALSGLAAVRGRAQAMLREQHRTPLPAAPMPTAHPNPILQAATDYGRVMDQNQVLRAQLAEKDKELEKAYDANDQWQAHDKKQRAEFERQLQTETSFLRAEHDRARADRDALKAQVTEMATTISALRSMAFAMLELAEEAEKVVRGNLATDVTTGRRPMADGHDHDPPPDNALEPVHVYDDRINGRLDNRLPNVRP